MDYSELRPALRALGVSVDEREALRVLQGYDADGNGLLELGEFARLARQLRGEAATWTGAVRHSRAAPPAAPEAPTHASEVERLESTVERLQVEHRRFARESERMRLESERMLSESRQMEDELSLLKSEKGAREAECTRLQKLVASRVGEAQSVPQARPASPAVGLLALPNASIEPEVQMAFDIFDSDRDGVLSQSELQADILALRCLRPRFHHPSRPAATPRVHARATRDQPAVSSTPHLRQPASLLCPAGSPGAAGPRGGP